MILALHQAWWIDAGVFKGLDPNRGDPIKSRINIGCGKNYKPGYINIDQYDRSVADKTWDAFDLPVFDGTVSEIRAEHLIEHFDWINLRYLFTEWGRVLREGGILDIETPDAKRSLRMTARSRSKEDLQWTFGIGSPGQSHGGLYDRKYLQSELALAGFGGFTHAEPSSYPGKPVTRIRALRNRKGIWDDAAALFRKQVRQHYGGDSYVLIPVEEYVSTLVQALGSKDRSSFRDKLIETAFRDPSLSLIMLRTVTNHDPGPPLSDQSGLGQLFEVFEKGSLHKRMFTLWIKREKGPEGIPEGMYGAIRSFAGRIEEAVAANAELPPGLDFLKNQEPTEIAVFSPLLVIEKAREFANQGVKEFSKGRLDPARSLFERSAGAAPGYVLPLWNLGRVLGLQNDNATGPVYEKAIRWSKGRLYDAIKAEAASGGRHNEPVDESELASFH